MAIHRLQINSPNRAKSNSEHATLCCVKVKIDTVKKVLVISAISLLIILSVGSYLFSLGPPSTVFQVIYMGSGIPAFLILGESIFEIAKRYDILPSCMYRK